MCDLEVTIDMPFGGALVGPTVLGSANGSPAFESAQDSLTQSLEQALLDRIVSRVSFASLLAQQVDLEHVVPARHLLFVVLRL